MSERRYWPPMVSTIELGHLLNMLRLVGVQNEWLCEPEMGGCSIKIPSLEQWRQSHGISVIQYYGSYGGRDGKLEIWIKENDEDESEPVGWLSAGEAYTMIMEAMRR